MDDEDNMPEICRNIYKKIPKNGNVDISCPPSSDGNELSSSCSKSVNHIGSLVTKCDERANMMTNRSILGQNGSDTDFHGELNGKTNEKINFSLLCDAQNIKNNEITDQDSNSEFNASPNHQRRKRKGDQSKAHKHPSLICSECNKVFADSASFEKHLKMHGSSAKHKRGRSYEKRNKTSGCLSSHEVETQSPVCQYCSEVSGNHDLNKQHEKLHKADNTFKCLVCSQTFRAAQELKDHTPDHQEQNFLLYLCQSNGRGASNKRVRKSQSNGDDTTTSNKKITTGENASASYLFKHSRSYSSKINIKLKLRHKETDTHIKAAKLMNAVDRERLKEATEENNSKDRRKDKLKAKTCDICGKVFARSANVAVHMRLHRGERPFSCFTCGKSFRRSDHLKNHELVHFRNKIFHCDSCDETFKRKDHLKYHQINNHGVKIHLNELKSYTRTVQSQRKTILCDVCGISFANERNLKIHLKIHSDQGKFSCKFCGKMFNQSSNLNIHLRKHTGETPYKCLSCDQSFATSAKLKTHARKHTGDLPFACEICGRLFGESHLLKMHMRIHDSHKAYGCNHCDKMFTHSSTLRAHVRTHTGARPYKCDQCGDAFAQISSLTYHKRTHSGEKPYSCHICGNSYTRMATLNIHLTRHTGQKRFSCPHCEFKCDTPKHLRKHVCKVHSELKDNVDALLKQKHGCSTHALYAKSIKPVSCLPSNIIPDTNQHCPTNSSTANSKHGQIHEDLTTWSNSQILQKPTESNLPFVYPHNIPINNSMDALSDMNSLNSYVTIGKSVINNILNPTYSSSNAAQVFTYTVSYPSMAKYEAAPINPQLQCLQASDPYVTASQSNQSHLQTEEPAFESGTTYQAKVANVSQEIPYFNTHFQNYSQNLSLPSQVPSVSVQNYSQNLSLPSQVPSVSAQNTCLENSSQYSVDMSLVPTVVQSALTVTNPHQPIQPIVSTMGPTSNQKSIDSLSGSVLSLPQNTHLITETNVLEPSATQPVTTASSQSHITKPQCKHVIIRHETSRVTLISPHVHLHLEQYSENTVSKECEKQKSNDNFSKEKADKAGMHRTQNETGAKDENDPAKTDQDGYTEITPEESLDEADITDDYSACQNTTKYLTSNKIKTKKATDPPKNSRTLRSADRESGAKEKEYKCKLHQKNKKAVKLVDKHRQSKPRNRSKVSPKSKEDSTHVSLVKKLRAKQSKGPVECKVCGQTFSRTGNLTTHMRLHTGEQPYSCNICNKKYTRSDHLKAHMCMHNEDLSLLCNHCGEKFNTLDILNAHTEERHRGRNPFACNVCEFSCINLSELKNHVRKHEDKNPFHCEVCEISFNKAKELKKHMESHDGLSPFVCHTCNKTFKESSCLKLHMMTKHTGERRFKCGVCDDAFVTAAKLQRHMRIHSGVRPYTCEFCGKMFIDTALLKMHVRIHTNEKPFKCKHCGQCFTHRSTLRAHVRIHTGNKPYTCDICNASFAQVSSLTYHKRRHDGLKPYTCHICGNSYTRSTTLNIHMTRHTGLKRFSCSQCKYKCDTPKHLRKHMAKVHNKTKQPTDSVGPPGQDEAANTEVPGGQNDLVPAENKAVIQEQMHQLSQQLQPQQLYAQQDQTHQQLPQIFILPQLQHPLQRGFLLSDPLQHQAIHQQPHLLHHHQQHVAIQSPCSKPCLMQPMPQHSQQQHIYKADPGTLCSLVASRQQEFVNPNFIAPPSSSVGHNL